MSEIIHGQIKHSEEQHKYKDALFMTTEEYFSKYEVTLENKIIFKITRPVAFFGSILILVVLVAASQ